MSLQDVPALISIENAWAEHKAGVLLFPYPKAKQNIYCFLSYKVVSNLIFIAYQRSCYSGQKQKGLYEAHWYISSGTKNLFHNVKILNLIPLCTGFVIM